MTKRKRRGLPVILWLMVGAVLVVMAILYLFNGGLDFAGGGVDPTTITVESGGNATSPANALLDGASEALAAPDGTNAEVAPVR